MLIVEKLAEHAHLRSNENAMSQKIEGAWQHLTWQQVWEQAQQIAAHLTQAGVVKGDRVAIFANNSMYWSMIDIACMSIGAISVPVYATSTPIQLSYILDHSEAKVLFADPDLLDTVNKANEAAPLNAQVITIDVTDSAKASAATLGHWLANPAPAVERVENHPDDILTIVYTSGTTGNPKGVMITHGNQLAAIEAHLKGIEFNAGERSLAALPLSHIFERGWTYIVLYAGGHNHYLADVLALQEQLLEVKPHVFCAVPRVFEKIHAGVFQKAKKAGVMKYAIVNWASARVQFNQRALQKGRKLSSYSKAMQALATRLVGKKIQQALGGNIRFMPCGGAALDPDIHGFFMGLGVNVKIGYGMTETLATVSFMPDHGYKLGSLGRPMPGIDIRIAPENGEIQVRSPSMTPGYYKDEKATAELYKDGWLQTGDAGSIDSEGNLVFRERLKELMKTSGGKYIAPQHVEGVLIRERLFEQVAVIADAKNYASALIVPAWEALEECAQSLNIHYENRLELIRNSKIIEAVEERLQVVQAELARYEQIKKFTLLPREFSVELGEITPTLKLKRRIISERFATEIKAMY
jgi:long-chain acyl-CoA synthetase